jgi:iron-sulfur cluster assembly protein
MQREGTTSTAPTTPSEKSGVASGSSATGEKAASAKATVSLSPKAIEAAKKQLAKRGTPDAAIRLGLKGGGCSGFSYVIEFTDDPPRERDRVFDFDGVKVFVDPKSLIYLAGTVLDWEQTLMYQGFKFRNPNEATNCGCGHSFSV